MKTNKYLLLISAFLLVYSNLFAWTSSNEGIGYTMDTLCLLSDSISYNQVDQMYEVDCDIVILENDTLRILAGEIVKFLSYTFPTTINYGITIYGCFIAIGENDKIIYLGDPEMNFSAGHWWTGLHFINTSQSGESVIKYCIIIGATDAESDWTETALYCENSSPIIEHCIFEYIASGEMTGGASAIGLKGQSYPLVEYCTFRNIMHGVVNPRSAPLITGINEEELKILPTTSNYLVLKNNYPNPFSNYTTIEFEITNNISAIDLLIYDSKGMLVRKLIRKKTFSKGIHNINWYGDDDNGSSVSKGVYFYKLISGSEMKVKKAILVK